MLDKEKLKKFLLNNFTVSHLASGGKEVVIRCPFCGDSQKKKNDAHFYIGLQEDKDTEFYQTPPKYHCFLCERSGILSGDTLLEITGFNIDDNDLVRDLNELFTKYKRNNKYKVKNNKIYNLTTIGCYQDTLLNRNKLNYLNYRLGLNLSIDECLKNKIVFDLSYFLYYNGIQKYTLSNGEIAAISENYIGFLSLDNSFITLRNCFNKNMSYNSLKKRYINYSIFGNTDDNINKMRYYCLNSKININDINNKINIHVAEGPFDILSIVYNLRDNNRYNNIYFTSAGKGYYSAIKEVIKFLKINPNMNIHIYPDNDVIDKKITYMAKRFTKIDIPVFIHRNMKGGEKDFGVPLNRIREVIRRL